MMFLDTVSLVTSVFLTPSLLDLYLLALSIIVISSESSAGVAYVNLSSISCGLRGGTGVTCVLRNDPSAMTTMVFTESASAVLSTGHAVEAPPLQGVRGGVSARVTGARHNMRVPLLRRRAAAAGHAAPAASSFGSSTMGGATPRPHR